MGAIPSITDAAFKTEVVQSAQPVLVHFHAEWCGPCKVLAPILDDLSRELGGKLRLVQMDIDECPDLAAACNVATVPTLVLFRRGREVFRQVGAAPLRDLLSKVTFALD